MNTASANNLITNTPGLPTWVIVIGVVVGLVIIAVLITNMRYDASPWWADRYNAVNSIWSWFGGAQPQLLPSGGIQTIPLPGPPAPAAPPTQPSATRGVRETWCFVGEDFTGRYCIKVPSEDLCDAERSYRSREACTLVEASSMPGGVIQKGGAEMKPLSQLNLH